MSRRKKARIDKAVRAGPKHQVVTCTGGEFLYRKTPCAECPWRRDSPVGEFPAEAFRLSAKSAYDMASTTFACHMSGKVRPAICAGFLMRGAHHNLSMRLARSRGALDPSLLSEEGVELYDNYREMAEANDVDPADPALAPCRD